ncbi:MAG: phosphoglucosamine mutase [Gammaproteobacteria bacterium]|nr:phosphoglucosamine mutase [Gammaproteobacteria bacterium]
MSEGRRWFGTDGVRGCVGKGPMTPKFALKLGWAAARVLRPEGGGVAVIGKDTRLSGYMFESALEAGFAAAGMNIRLLGPLPTPAIAQITRSSDAAVGVVISASHNPSEDNGIKLFGSDGRKLPDSIELEIEKMLAIPMKTVAGELIGQAQRMEDARDRYVSFCKTTLPATASFAGLKIVLDCANGADYAVAPRVFRELGATVVAVAAQPDGHNINDGCGSTHPEHIREAVCSHGADYGFAFDGDGDRVVAADSEGRIYGGDELLYVIAMERAARQALQGPVVGTVMSNLGLEQALARAGIGFERTQVGDRYVLERLSRTGGILGGENSGHIICLDCASTGDGIVAALAVTHRIVTSRTALVELCRPLTMRPQVLLDAPLNGRGRREVMNDVALAQAVAEIEARLGENGRVLLRPSGTQPLIRVMVEGADKTVAMACAEELRAAVETAATR